MSYAIVRNEKLTRSQAQGICVHNDRKAKNHSNKEIDTERTPLNYYLKKNELNYVKEFDRLKEQNDLKGQIRSNSIIICEMIFTSDEAFFNKIGIEETKRYFKESYEFICNYKRSSVSGDSSKLFTESSQGASSRNKNLGEKNIISAVVHLDEGTPHMHLVYIPVIHTHDKDGNSIDKVCCRDFWKGRDSYRKLQNAYYEYITSKGFELERGLPAEETGRKHETIQNYKQLTNFENTKEVSKNITLELPKVPDIKDIKKIVFNRDEKITNEIIKPKDELIQKLYTENRSLHEELSKQEKLVDMATEYENNHSKIIADNNTLKQKCSKLEEDLENKEKDFDNRIVNKIKDIDSQYRQKINDLEKENKKLYKMIDKFKVTLKKFIRWLCHKFDFSSEDQIIRDFERETHNKFNVEKQLDINQFEKKEKYYER